MDEPAQHIPPLDTQAIGGLVGRVRLWVRRPEIETAVGPLHVVVGDVGPKDPLQMSAAEHGKWIAPASEPGPTPSAFHLVPVSSKRRPEVLDREALEAVTDDGDVPAVSVAY